jgi:hypothetical protein
VKIQWEYDPISEEGNIANPEARYFIKHVIWLKPFQVRLIRFIHPTRGDLEILYYGREMVEAFAAADDQL